MRKLYLVRHAMPDFKDGEKLCIGSTDIDIGSIGRQEALLLQNFFKDKEIEAIFSSPLSRSISTAKIIAHEQLEIYVEDDLREVYMGSWEGRPLKSIKKNLGDEPEDGEKRVDALARMEKKLIEIMEKTVGDIVCVAHAGVNCAFIAKVTGGDIKTSRTIKQPYASYSSFEYKNKSFFLLEFGITPPDNRN